MSDSDRLVTIDPGQALGWAFFKSKILTAAGRSSPEDYCDDMPTEARLLTRKVVIELPQNWPGKTPVTSIIVLAVRVGELKQYWKGRGADVKLVWPTSWKGTVPKKIHHERILEALSDEERKLLPRRPRAKDHDPNTLDAVGIGLKELGRL